MAKNEYFNVQEFEKNLGPAGDYWEDWRKIAINNLRKKVDSDEVIQYIVESASKQKVLGGKSYIVYIFTQKKVYTNLFINGKDYGVAVSNPKDIILLDDIVSITSHKNKQVKRKITYKWKTL